MTNITVESLAKTLKVKSEDVLKCLESLGSFVPNAKATMTMEEIRKVCLKLTGKEPRFRKASPAKKPEDKTVSEKAAAEKAAAEKAAAEKAAAEKAAAEKAAAEKAAAEKAAAEDKAAAEKAAAEKAAAEKAAAEKAAAEKAAAEKAAAEKAAAEKAAAEKAAVEKTAEKAAAKEEVRPSRDSQPRRNDRSQNNGADRRSDRRANGDRPNSDRGASDRSNRSNSDRPYSGNGRSDRSGSDRNGSDRPFARRDDRNSDRPGSDRRSGGDRPYSGNGRGTSDRSNAGGDRRNNDRPSFDKDKDADNRTQNNRRGTSAGGRRPSGMDLPEVQKDSASSDKAKKADRVRREKDKERTRNQASDNFGHKHKNLMQYDASGEDENVKVHVKKNKNAVKQQNEEEEIKVVALPPTMTVREFAEMVRKPVVQIIKSLMLKGKMMGQNDDLEYELAEELAMDMDILAEPMQEEDIFRAYTEVVDDPDSLQTRPPVVVVMGHVDHGKTSLLDAIRETKVTAGEAGGITQHIGASIVTINGKKITFLDTPGHEAFTAMRMRGAMVTDIAILVVAADDGIMPQTIEAINHAKAAGVQIIVAINKMDKPEANPDHVKQQLTEYELIPEEWGGSTICVPVSAKTGQGVDDLLEMILTVAELEEYKANPNRAATGHIIEAQLDKGRGVVATALVQNGTLHVSDSIVVGKAFGKIKAMNDDNGKKVRDAAPSMAVEILGLSEVPVAGEPFYVTPGEREARQLAEKVMARDRRKMIEGTRKVSLEGLFDQIQAGEMKELNIVVKADVQGSVEAVRQSLEKLSNDKVVIRTIHGAVGAINESDVMLASTSGAIIIGFNVRPENSAKAMAEEQKVDVRLYRVIYDAIDDIEAAMKGMLDPEYEEKITGHAQIRQLFKASGVGTIAGSYITDGKIVRASKVRLLRDNIVVYDGEIASLRRGKDDVREVNFNYECGILLKDFNDIKEGDVIEAYVMEQIKAAD